MAAECAGAWDWPLVGAAAAPGDEVAVGAGLDGAGAGGGLGADGAELVRGMIGWLAPALGGVGDS